MFHAVIIVQAAAAAVAAQQAKRREALGLPPLPAPPPAKPTRADKWAEFWFWVMVLSPALLFAAIVGLFLFAAMKIAFAIHGISFP